MSHNVVEQRRGSKPVHVSTIVQSIADDILENATLAQRQRFAKAFRKAKEQGAKRSLRLPIWIEEAA